MNFGGMSIDDGAAEMELRKPDPLAYDFNPVFQLQAANTLFTTS